jgi:dTDP-4-dehydrorhamnose 3,5-epimerase
MFEIRPTTIPGCVVLYPRVVPDDRGRFVKVFHRQWFEDHGLDAGLREEYFSDSKAGVLRGMHYQDPPHDHVKIVYVIRGAVMDVVLDMRVGSPTFGRAEAIELDGKSAAMVYVPKGLAHGFYAREASTTVYRVTTEYAPSHDKGVLWSSVAAPWPDLAPILSERDRGFPVFGGIESPFRYG